MGRGPSDVRSERRRHGTDFDGAPIRQCLSLSVAALDGPLVSRSYMFDGMQRGQMVAVEFYKMAIGGGVGRLLERRRLADFADRQEFELWAQTALALRRKDPDVWEWPEAVRVCDAGNQELYVWTLWDQVQAGKPVV